MLTRASTIGVHDSAETMLSTLQAFSNFIDTLNEYVGRLVAWLTFVMVLVTFLIVVLRYGFDFGLIAMQESVVYMHAFVFMAAAAYTLKHNDHVRVDIFYRALSPAAQAWIDLLGSLILLLPLCGFILWSSWAYVLQSWQLLEGSREAGGLPLVFLLKSLIPLLAVLLFLQGLSLTVRSLLVLAGDDPAQA